FQSTHHRRKWQPALPGDADIGVPHNVAKDDRLEWQWRPKTPIPRQTPPLIAEKILAPPLVIELRARRIASGQTREQEEQRETEKRKGRQLGFWAGKDHTKKTPPILPITEDESNLNHSAS
ncbi:MAG: hypothetical protein WA771_02390, partial [Chthoniobacterales bacterium]